MSIQGRITPYSFARECCADTPYKLARGNLVARRAPYQNGAELGGREDHALLCIFTWRKSPSLEPISRTSRRTTLRAGESQLWNALKGP
eukprot:6200807-Pleurochrysis_carterae.AAC.2